MPSSSLVPEDETVLLTSAGMQQFVSYLSGQKDVLKDFGCRHLASAQKCFRTSDIDQVGDNTHNTFFEMLGNWSIGEDSERGYFKEGAITLALDFFVGTLGLDKTRFWVTIFKGEQGVPRDEISLEIWQKQGILKERIREFGIDDNFWGPVTKTGPCGPCSEIHYDRGEQYGCGSRDCGPNCKTCERFVELWNLVFMEYEKKGDGSYKKLSQRNVDTGIGFDRLVAVLQEKPSPYETDLLWPLIQKIEELSGKKYLEHKKTFRIIADHMRGAVFLIADGVRPSNLGREYIARRILRRMIRAAYLLGMQKQWSTPLVSQVKSIYGDAYPEVKNSMIGEVIAEEQDIFSSTLANGMRELERLMKTKTEKKLSGKDAFYLYESFGFPVELTGEIAAEKGFTVDTKGFQEAFSKHQEISRKATERKFGGHGLLSATGGLKARDKEELQKVTRLHTATHLLHQALRTVLGSQVKQMGSDITPERTRFDFNFSRKLTKDELKLVEDLVNEKIEEDLPVHFVEMQKEEAEKTGALHFFKEKYPDVVRVYYIGYDLENAFSKEFCGGPHVKKTSEIGSVKIIKEESSGAGVRRIRAVLKDDQENCAV